MYARHFTFRSSPDKRPAIEALADDIYRFTKAQPGFVSATYFASLDETEYGSMTLWSSREAAENAGTTIREEIGDRLNSIVSAPPETAILEVFEPSTA